MGYACYINKAINEIKKNNDLHVIAIAGSKKSRAISQLGERSKNEECLLMENLYLCLCTKSEAGADLGGGCRGYAPSLEMKPSSSYWRLKFVYLTDQ